MRVTKQNASAQIELQPPCARRAADRSTDDHVFNFFITLVVRCITVRPASRRGMRKDRIASAAGASFMRWSRMLWAACHMRAFRRTSSSVHERSMQMRTPKYRKLSEGGRGRIRVRPQTECSEAGVAAVCRRRFGDGPVRRGAALRREQKYFVLVSLMRVACMPKKVRTQSCMRTIPLELSANVTRSSANPLLATQRARSDEKA